MLGVSGAGMGDWVSWCIIAVNSANTKQKTRVQEHNAQTALC